VPDGRKERKQCEVLYGEPGVEEILPAMGKVSQIIPDENGEQHAEGDERVGSAGEMEVAGSFGAAGLASAADRAQQAPSLEIVDNRSRGPAHSSSVNEPVSPVRGRRLPGAIDRRWLLCTQYVRHNGPQVRLRWDMWPKVIVHSCGEARRHCQITFPSAYVSVGYSDQSTSALGLPETVKDSPRLPADARTHPQHQLPLGETDCLLGVLFQCHKNERNLRRKKDPDIKHVQSSKPRDIVDLSRTKH
jgi:hypothetical protein